MGDKNKIQSHHSTSSRIKSFVSLLNPFSGIKIHFLFFTTTFLFISGCASFRAPFPPATLQPDETAGIISNMQDQEDMVSSFYTLGTVSIKGLIWDSDADVLIAGIKAPLKVKIEITHPWGKPILFFLIKNKRLEVLSFQEKKIYSGKLRPESLSGFFPERLFSPDLIWSVLRGYPPISDHNRAESSDLNRINLFNNEGDKVEVIDLNPENSLPFRIDLPGQSVVLTFSDYKKSNGIYYAGEVIMDDTEGDRDLILRMKNSVFNRDIPEEIFTLENLPGFEIVYMD